jgi:type I restriction enzyme S subunit
LNEIAKIERGKFSHRPRNEPRFYGGEYPFVQTGDVSNCDGYVRSYTQTLNEAGLAISKMLVPRYFQWEGGA